MHDELDPLLHIRNLVRQRRLAQLHARAGFVNQIDSLVRQKAIGNVAVRMRHREFNCLFGIRDRMEFLIPFLDSVDDLHCVAFIWWRHFHRLEATLQRTILLDRFAILARRRSADALNLTTRERRL